MSDSAEIERLRRENERLRRELAALRGEAPQPPARRNPMLPAWAQGQGGPLHAATRSLGTALLRWLAARQPGENLFLSPASISLALAMTLNAASGSTAEELAALLGLPGAELEALNDAARLLIDDLGKLDLKAAEMEMFGAKVRPEEHQVLMTVANGLWTDQAVPIRADFVERVRAAYRAEAAAVDLGAAEALDRINAWVKERTSGRIDQILKPFANIPLAVLVNAVCFKGGWQNKFDGRDTAEGPFHLADGSTRPIPLMRQVMFLPYREDARLQLVGLPFRSGRRSLQPGPGVSALIALPKPGHSLEELISGLSAGWWAEQVALLNGQPGPYVDLTLPRFRIEFDADLIPALSELGLAEAFAHGRADLSRLSDLPAAISQVSHKTFLLVNEEGCEAAGATAVSMESFGALPEQIEMRVDRPFLLAIVTHPEPILLFVGAVHNPEPAV